MFRNIVSNELFTILMVLGLILVTIAKVLSPKRFFDFVSVIGNSKYLKIYSKEQKFFDKFDALLFINLLISLTVFGLIIYQSKTDSIVVSPELVAKLMSAIGVFILIKVFIERLVASLFEMDKIIDQYLFQKISYKNFLGVLLLPLNAVLVYSFEPTLTIIYIIVILLVLVILFGLITSFKTHQSSIKNNFFYFILYLCALEIAPYIILYKLLGSK